MFIRLLFEDWRSFCAISLRVIFSVCVHEYLHALTALKQGDPTAADRGHLTLSPFKQMGFISLIMLLLIGIAWGQIPVNPENLKTRKSRLLVIFAGVFANLCLVLLFTLGGCLTQRFAPRNLFAADMLFDGAVLNVVLFLINLLPVPGFDGFNAVLQFIRFKTKKSREIANAACFIMLLVIFFFMDKVIGFAEYLVTTLAKLMIRVMI